MTLPDLGSYGCGILFTEDGYASEAKAAFGSMAADLDLEVIWWREVPKNNACLGQLAADIEPLILQVFVADKKEGEDGKEFEECVCSHLHVFTQYNFPRGFPSTPSLSPAQDVHPPPV